MQQVHALDHPLARHKIGLLRATATGSKLFREIASELAAQLLWEATRDLPLVAEDVDGWAGPVRVERLAAPLPTLVPILRAGLGMLAGAQQVLPGAPVSVLGLERDHRSLEPRTYYTRLAPDIGARTAIILDPMLATAGSFIAAVEQLRAAGCRDIRGAVLVAAPEGLQRVGAAHPDVGIWTAAIDARLDARGYILPGLGDAGDRLFGTDQEPGR